MFTYKTFIRKKFSVIFKPLSRSYRTSFKVKSNDIILKLLVKFHPRMSVFSLFILACIEIDALRQADHTNIILRMSEMWQIWNEILVL